MLKYQEIEHKYLVDAAYDLAAFAAVARQLKPAQSKSLKVTDTYYVVQAMPNHVVRHRIDNELQQLTIKSTGADNECRTEVNLNLDLRAGNQTAEIEAFLQPLNVLWAGSIEKNILVFYFDDCEVVHYSARSGDGKTVQCVEFEATKKASREEALSTIGHFEVLFGFHSERRSSQSLFELLFAESLPDNVRKFMNSRR